MRFKMPRAISLACNNFTIILIQIISSFLLESDPMPTAPNIWALRAGPEFFSLRKVDDESNNRPGVERFFGKEADGR